MDLSTMIVDLLRNSEEEEILNRGGPLAKAGPKQQTYGAEVGAAGMTELAIPGYTAYKREALSSGEPVLSPEEFKAAKAEGRL